MEALRKTGIHFRIRLQWGDKDHLRISVLSSGTVSHSIKDLRRKVVKIFLGKGLTDEAIDHVVEMSTFKNVNTNPSARSFFKTHVNTKITMFETLDMVTPYSFRHKRRIFLVMNKLQPSDLDALQDFEVRPTDIFLLTYPKSGTVWMQQILVQIMGAAQPDWIEDVTNRTHVPWLEGHFFGDPLQERPEPRIFNSHLPPDMLPHGVKNKQIKVVYVWRNPKDVLVSMYHFSHSHVFLETPQSFEAFFQQFLDGDVIVGSWFDHVKEFYAARDQLNIHFVQYEHMLKDLRQEVVKLCAFLGKDLTDEAIDHVVEMSSFKNMKTNPKANYKDFVENHIYTKATMRKGVAGDWKNHFTVAQNEHFDKVWKEKMSSFPVTCTWEIKP